MNFIPNVKYKFVFTNEKTKIIKFTEENFINDDEILDDYTNYECYDTNNTRYIFYSNDDYNKLRIYLKKRTTSGDIIKFSVYEIYMDCSLIYKLNK